MISKKKMLKDIEMYVTESAFYPFRPQLQEYAGDNILMGYIPFGGKPDEYLICLTIDGRDTVIKKLRKLRESCMVKIGKLKFLEPGKWKSLGSEKEIEEFYYHNTRPLMNLEWVTKLSLRNVDLPKFQDFDAGTHRMTYNSIHFTGEKPELIYRMTIEQGVQTHEPKLDKQSQTIPQIPTNAAIQCVPETEIPEDAKERAASFSEEKLNEFMKKYSDFLMNQLHYNEVYDLYNDEYPQLAEISQQLLVPLPDFYEQYQNFTDVAAVEGKSIVSSAWSTKYSGIVAVAYADEVNNQLKYLDSEFDDIDGEPDYESDSTNSEKSDDDDSSADEGEKWLAAEKKEKESRKTKNEDDVAFQRANAKIKQLQLVREMSDKRKELEEKRRVDSLSIFSLQTPSSSVEPKGSEKADRQFLKEEKKEKIRTDLVLGISNKARRLTDFDVFMSREKLKRRVYERGKTKESVGRRKRILVPVSTSLDDETESLCAIWGDNYNWVHEASLRSAIRRMHIHHKRKRRAFQSVRPLLANIPWPQIYPMNDNIDVEQSTSERSSHQRTSPSVHISSSSAGVSVSRHPSKSSTIMSTSSKFKKEMRHKHRTIPKFDHSITEHYDEVIDFDEVQAKREELPILLPNNPVLIWGFNDDLLPKLRLDCPFELTCIRFHLSNGNILVGCTKSGQVVLWDLRGRIEKVDEPPSINSEDEKHRMKLSEWMHWTKDIRSKRRVPITAISSYYDSHVEQATNLQFVHPFLKFMPNGKVRNLEPGEPPSEQFVTSALSGSVLFWDLDITKIKRKQKRKKIVDQPSSLYVQHSPYDCLNNNWKPFLKVNVLTDELIPTPLLGLSLDVIPVNYNRITPEPPPGKPDSLEDCIEYAADYSDVPKFSYTFTIGTARGNVGLLTLQPENMPSGVIEIPITQNWFKNMHDGPVTHIYKNPFINELIITSGGHVWAIWHTDYVEYPIIWRKYHNVRITCCLWSTFRPSLFRIAKSCGSIEIWDLLRQSHKPQKEITVSGQLITDLSGPVLPLQHGILSAGDYNTALRLFYIPWQYQVWTEDELKKFTSMIHYEPGRQKNLKKWRDWWREKYGRKTVKRKELQEQRRKEEEQRVKEDEARKKYNEEVYKWYMRRRGKQFVFAEEAKAKFEAKQREHMFNVVVSKKKIDRTQMEKLVQPLVKIEKLEKLRQEKVKERLKHADELFNQAVIKIFPKGLEEEDIIQQDETDLIKRVLLEVDYKFGPDMEKLKDEILQEIYKNKWECSKRWPQLFAEYTASREVFNKPLNRRKMSTRWLRKKLLKSLTEEGNRIIQYKSKKEVYAEMKYKNREKRLTELKEMYGENYIPDWNKHKKITRFNDWKEMILQPPEVHLIEEKITMKKREESDEDLQETKKELVKEISEKELVKEISEKELVKELSEKDLVKELSEKEEMLLEDVDLLEVLQTLSLTSTVQKEKLKEISDISELDIDTELIIDETRRSDLLPVLPSPTGLSDLSLKPDSQTSLFYSEKNMEIDPIPHGFTSTKLSIGRPIEMVKNLQQVVKAVREESGKIEEMHESEEEQYEGEDEEYSETKERKSKPDEEREKMRQIEEQEKGEEHERRKTTQHRETTELKRGHDHEPQVKEEEDIDDSASIDEEETENEKRLEQID
ncbi:missing minor mitochondria isoform X4 [Lycorma delicatula]|uniref:missing minor mitochondria isoform X4 n=1 Tax=Lycorma delicatula TaxID=130591 RepID=UPI003F517B68